MKIRTDYVTNSSSSSFILAFKDEEDLMEFREYLDMYSYEEFSKLFEERGMDSFHIYNNKDDNLNLDEVIEYIERFPLPFKLKLKLDNLKGKGILIDFLYLLPINRFGEEDLIDIESLRAIEVDNDDFQISIQKGATSKEEALNLLEHSYRVDLERNLIDSKYNSRDYKTYKEYLDDVRSFEESIEFKEIIQKQLFENKEYIEKREKLLNAKFSFKTEIWDTDGGLLEWAIRNGFVEDNFYKNHILTWNVG